MKSILTISLLFLLPLNIFASDFIILSSRTEVVPSTTVQVAETAHIVVSLNTNQKIIISTFTAPILNDFQILKIENPQAEKSGSGEWTAQMKISFLPMSAGEIIFPPLSIPFKTGEGEEKTVETPPVKMSAINSIGSDVSEEMLKDIKPPLSVGISILAWLSLCAAIGALCALWLKFRRRKTELSPQAPPAPSKAAEEIVMEKFALALENYKRSGDFKLFYIELSNAFREYLFLRFEVEAMEKTTSEIFSEMRKKEIERKTCLEAKDMLSSYDLVKFAKFIPSEKQVLGDFARAKEFVEKKDIPLK